MIKINPKLNWMDRAIQAMAPKWGVRRLRNRYLLEFGGYKAADITRIRDNWILPGDDRDKATPTTYDLSLLRTRSRDANRNDPIAAGATETLKQNIVGNGLQPQSKIRSERLNISEERARKLQFQAERAWAYFSPQADSANILDIDEMQFLTIAKIIEDGEAIIIPTWANEEWRHFGRCLELLESERLKAPSGEFTNAPHGIIFGKRGQPLSYWIKKAGAKSSNKDDFSKIAAKDSTGRPKILHIFQMRRPGQKRGVPLFAPVLSYFKDLADYMEAELVAARVAACLAIFITKTDPMGSALALGTSTESDGDRVQEIEPGMVSYLGFGESISTVEPKRQGDSFGAFVENIMRVIGVAIGLPYELLIKDFSKANYSSARAALLEGRRMFMGWRKWFARKFCQPIWDMVIEEAYLRGEFDAPDFYWHRQEYCRAQWIGGGWGWVDPVKEVEASRKAIDYGLSTLAEEAAAQGRIWEDILDQRSREDQKIAELNIEILKSQKGEKQNAQAQEERE